MIRIRSNNPDMIYVSIMDIHGGQEICFSLASNVIDAINWTNEYRARLDKEVKLRETNPALSNSWNEYQTMLRIVMDDV